MLQKRLWSDRTDAVLICLASSFLPLLAGGFGLLGGGNPLLNRILLAAGLGAILAAVAIARKRAWGGYLAAALFGVAAVSILLAKFPSGLNVIGALFFASDAAYVFFVGRTATASRNAEVQAT